MWSTVLCVVILVSCASAYEDKTVYQYLVDNGFSEFVKLLNEAGLQNSLSGKGPFTVFAPSNAAIAGIPQSLTAAFTQNPQQKKVVIKYHVAPSFVLVPQIQGSKPVVTLAAQDIDIMHIGMSLTLNNVSHVDNSPNNDIICNNGVVQPIDSVLIPPVFGTDNIAAVLIERDDLFQEFLLSILLSNFTSVLESGDYTVFAPINNAYGELYKGILGSHIPPEKRAEIYYEILKYHLVPGGRTASALQNGQRLFTIHGTPVNITVNANGVMVNQAHVVAADIPASNGIIHAIDHLLFPLDMLPKLKALYAQYNNVTTTPPPSG